MAMVVEDAGPFANRAEVRAKLTEMLTGPATPDPATWGIDPAAQRAMAAAFELGSAP